MTGEVSTLLLINFWIEMGKIAIYSLSALLVAVAAFIFALKYHAGRR